MQPYELPQKKYALWLDVGERLGAKTQSLVADALCTGTHQIPLDDLFEGEKQVIEEMAARRGVLLFIR